MFKTVYNLVVTQSRLDAKGCGAASSAFGVGSPSFMSSLTSWVVGVVGGAVADASVGLAEATKEAPVVVILDR